jgi:hypothetical protein
MHRLYTYNLLMGHENMLWYTLLLSLSAFQRGLAEYQATLL